MPRPRPPSRVETVTFPVFALSWWASHEDGNSIVAFGGGGGSAATGVNNKIEVRAAGLEPVEISTQDQVCVAVNVYQNPLTKSIWLLGSVGKLVCRYTLPSCEPCGDVEVDGCNAIAVNVMADKMAVGCESGAVALHELSDDAIGARLWAMKTHSKAVCALSFSVRGGMLASSAKDGTAKVWGVANGAQLADLECDVKDPKDPPPKRPQQVLVRGCAFGDLEGKEMYTVASTKRGKAYLFSWVLKGKPGEGGFHCRQRVEVSPVPVSAMSLSTDGALMALGGVDGTITLMDMTQWKVLKKFPEVHELPVTCIAARPFALPLRGEENGVPIHAVCASADSQLPFLTLQKRAPKSKSASSSSGGGWFWTFFWASLVSWGVYQIAMEMKELCTEELNNMDLILLKECFLHTVMLAPASRPGILVPPH